MTIDCTEYQRLLSASLDAPLDATSQANLDAHLTECPACVGRMKDTIVLREAMLGLGAAERDTAFPPLRESLVARLLEAGRQARRGDARGRHQGIA
jgi:predicted anti-sigma-YlaC factor YlaD